MDKAIIALRDELLVRAICHSGGKQQPKKKKTPAPSVPHDVPTRLLTLTHAHDLPHIHTCTNHPHARTQSPLLRGPLSVLQRHDQQRRLSLARYGPVRERYEKAVLSRSKTELLNVYPDLTKAAIHIQMLNQRSKAYHAHISHLERVSSSLALEPFERVLDQEFRLLQERRETLVSLQRQRMQLVHDYSVAMDQLPACLTTGHRVQVVSVDRQNSYFGFTIVGGLGASVPPMIGKVYPNSPATAANVQVGDQIVRINNEDVTGLRHEEVIQRVRSSESRIVLAVRRAFEQGLCVCVCVRV